MALLNKVTKNTIDFSGIQFQLRADTKWYGILILLLYVAVHVLEKELFVMFTVQCVRRIHYLCHLLHVTAKLF